LRDWRPYASFADICNDHGRFRGLFRRRTISGQQRPCAARSIPGFRNTCRNEETEESLDQRKSPVASVRKQLDKLQGQVADIDKQLVDLKNFSEGEPSTSASGMKLHKNYSSEPIEVQMRALRNKKRDLESKIDVLLDEARKKGVESSQLR